MNTLNSDLLTARQVQDRLQVDRITVYRMLKDGRIKGVKIGQQWRFPATEVERLLSGAPALTPVGDGRVRAFPTHCVQTIQNLFSAISDLGAVVIDNDGQPLTQPVMTAQFARLLEETPSGQALCRQAWLDYAASGGGGAFTCVSGLFYAGAPVLDGGERIGWFLCGPALPAGTNLSSLPLARLASEASLNESVLRDAAAGLPAAGQDQQARMHHWAEQAAGAIQSILTERSGFLQRLDTIARISNLDS